MSKRDIGLRSRIIKHLCLVSSTLLLGSCLPRIDRFHPSRAPTGTVVTIEGTNFGTTPAKNTVTFNGVPVRGGDILNSSSRIVKARVPSQATTGPISVRTARGVCFSPEPFKVLDQLPMDSDEDGINDEAERWTDSVPIIYSLKTPLMASLVKNTTIRLIQNGMCHPNCCHPERRPTHLLFQMIP